MKVFSRESLAGDERAGFCISRMNGVPHRPVRDDHVIGTRCKHSNVFSRGVLISRFLLGNLTITYFVLLHGMNSMMFTLLRYLQKLKEE